ncbi:MAG: glycoprotein [Rhodococcus sp. (in: high G+C Gram-positive bacteria)]|uniref:glycoprotein n=1 Tax=Rhodococcus sp. TaxID=1831 RepID=UPI003BB57B20
MMLLVHRSGAAVLVVLALVFVAIGGATAHADSDKASRFLELRIDAVTPSVVTDGSDPVVTVSGTVRNIGDRDVSDISVRLQRAPMITGTAELRTTLTLDQSGFDTVGEFESVDDLLEQDEERRFALDMPLRSATEPSLGIDTPGVYPLLVNVNGTPEYGGEARLDDARFLLPVLAVPSDGEDLPPVAPTGGDPAAVTMLWPLADKPRLAAGVAGSVTEPVRLVDDELATSLAIGGRLDGLLSAAESVVGIENRSRLAGALCLAVDPDLLVTVANMTRGYLVVDDPADPLGDAEEGSGTDAAISWLERLRAVAGATCTVAVPFAQVDPVALADVAASSAGGATLATGALTAPADIIDTILGVTSMRAVTWPDSGVLTEKAGRLLAENGPVTALLADSAVDASATGSSVTAPPATRISGVDGLTAALFDSSAAAALAAVGQQPTTPSFVPESARYDLGEDSATARLQDALGALAWPALEEPAESGAVDRSVLFAPSQTWSPTEDEATDMLSLLETLVRAGLAVPRPFEQVVASAAATVDAPDAALLSYPEQAIIDGASNVVVGHVVEQAPRLDALQLALIEDPQAQLTPQKFLAPLREDMLRSMSLAGRRGSDAASAEHAAYTRSTAVREAVDRMFGGVTVLSPGGFYTLTSEQSPLVLVARNDLPVGITVQLHVDAPQEMEITDIGPTQLPPRGSRTLTVPAQISDSRKLGVEFALTTESDLPLGTPTSVTVRSNAYGQVLAIVTGCAGALLLFLAGRRLLHRFRGEPDPADEGYESP